MLVSTMFLFAQALAAEAAIPPDPGCAQSNIVRLSPADVLDRADLFRDSLGAADRARLDAALPRAPDGRIASCDQSNGTSCDAMAYMPALRSTGLMPRFLATICGHGPTR